MAGPNPTDNLDRYWIIEIFRSLAASRRYKGSFCITLQSSFSNDLDSRINQMLWENYFWTMPFYAYAIDYFFRVQFRFWAKSLISNIKPPEMKKRAGCAIESLQIFGICASFRFFYWFFWRKNWLVLIFMSLPCLKIACFHFYSQRYSKLSGNTVDCM